MKENIKEFLIKSEIVNEEEVDIFIYGLFSLFFNLFSLFIVLLFGSYFDNILGSVIFLSSFIPLRVLSGGFHFKSPILCLLFFSFSTYDILYLCERSISFNKLGFVFGLIYLFIFFINTKDHSAIKLFFTIILLCNLIVMSITKNIAPYVSYSLIFNCILLMMKRFTLRTK